MSDLEVTEQLYDRLRKAEAELKHVRSERDRLFEANAKLIGDVNFLGGRLAEAGKPSVLDCLDVYVCCVHTPAEYAAAADEDAG